MTELNSACKQCGKKLAFLLQLNAPTVKAYYRYIYLFACLNRNCGKGFRAFRTQLPAKSLHFDHITENRLLAEHKDNDFIEGIVNCFEIESYPLDTEEYHRANAHNDDVDELFHFTYQRGQKPKEKKVEGELLASDTNDSFDDSDFFPEAENADADFMIYRNNIAIDPQHFLRYCFHDSTTPLYYTCNGKFDAEGRKKCSNCGANRIFEFQINSTLLSMIDSLSDFEWGVVAVYSCPNSCFGADYQEEEVCAQFDSDLAQTPKKEAVASLPSALAPNPQKTNQQPSVAEEVNEDDWN